MLYDKVRVFAERTYKASASKMSKEKYLILCEAQGIEPDPDVMPQDLEDFPDFVGRALYFFNNLRDTYIPGEIPTYNGKDLSSLPVLFDIYNIIDSGEKQVYLNLVNILDGAAYDASKQRIEAIRKKMKQN